MWEKIKKSYQPEWIYDISLNDNSFDEQTYGGMRQPKNRKELTTQTLELKQHYLDDHERQLDIVWGCDSGVESSVREPPNARFA